MKYIPFIKSIKKVKNDRIKMKKLNKILWIKFYLVKEAKEKFEDNYEM